MVGIRTLTAHVSPGQATMTMDRRFALVLGGGGLRGLSHVGALQEIEARGWEPSEVIGCSIGALVAATWASGFSSSEMESIARSLRRRDIFQLAHSDMAFKRMRAPSLYRSGQLQNLVYGLLGDITFQELPRRLIISAVEINSGMLVYFGLPGLDHVKVADAVIASCSLPGFFPPREIDGRFWVDGALVDNLPVHLAASRGMELVVAVDVGPGNALRADVQESGFANVYARASEIVFQQAMEHHLAQWTSPAMLLVQPRVEHVPMFSFDHTREMIIEGRRAMSVAIDEAGDAVRTAPRGIFPKRLMQLGVLRERCIGCGACVSLAPPGTFRMDAEGKAVARPEPLAWSAVDGGYVRHCPTYAITAHPVAPVAAASTGGASTGTAPAPA
jgi:NTE family protein